MLRFRLSLLLALTLLVTVAAFGWLADVVYFRLQQQQLERLVMRDLERVQNLVETSAIGTRFVENDGRDYRLQFVSTAGAVILPPAEEALPLYQMPTLDRSRGRALLIGSLPWRLPSGNEWGTIRLALDIQPFIDARRLLLNSLLLSGFVIALAVTLFSLMILRRTMRPLQVLAKEAVEIDPANPRLTSYVGPEDEVATLARALDRTLEAIRERQQAERDALAEIAHELAAPLSVVSGQLNSLAGDKTSDVRFLAARDAANELLYSSQDLLTLARGELDFKFELSALDLLQVAERVANEYPGVKVLGSSVEVLASYERMVQVVRNLVRNAVQASGSPDKVTVRLEASGSQTLLHVQDRGPGLSDDVKAHLFERYYSRKQGGTGVGLVVARNIIEQHEGTIEVSSTLGEGSCFTVRLPSLEAQLEDSDTIQDEP